LRGCFQSIPNSSTCRSFVYVCVIIILLEDKKDTWMPNRERALQLILKPDDTTRHAVLDPAGRSRATRSVCSYSLINQCPWLDPEPNPIFFSRPRPRSHRRGFKFNLVLASAAQSGDKACGCAAFTLLSWAAVESHTPPTAPHNTKPSVWPPTEWVGCM
jgi:hypothetical protein